MDLEKIYVYSNFFIKIVLLNFLWIIMTILGGVILGIAPSSIALMTIIRDDFRENKFFSTGIFESIKKFLMIYKSEFFKTNKIAFILVLILCLIYFNIFNLTKVNTKLSFLFLILSLGLKWFLTILICIIFSIYTHYKMDTKSYLLKSTVFLIVNPLIIPILIMWAFIINKIYEFFPAIAFLTGGYIFFYGLIMLSSEFFRRNDSKYLKRGE